MIAPISIQETAVAQADIAKSAHCDQPGWPSCHDVGFANGKAHPGTPCPPVHSTNFCIGWVAGAVPVGLPAPNPSLTGVAPSPPLIPSPPVYFIKITFDSIDIKDSHQLIGWP